MRTLLPVVALLALGFSEARAEQVAYFEVPRGAHPHDVAPAPDGTVWYTAQSQGAIGILDPRTGRARQVALGADSAPHGVIVGPDRAAWITDGGQNAIVRFDPATRAVKVFPLPQEFCQRQPQHRDFRPQGHPLVHRTERRLWPRRSGHRQGRGLEGAEGRRTLRYHHDAERRGLVCIARRRSHRQNRHRERRRAGGGAAQGRRRSAPHLVGLQGPAVGQLLDQRRSCPLRSGGEGLEDLEPAEEHGRLLRGFCRRQGQGLGVRLDRTMRWCASIR